jgi:hypothetical protein
VPVTAAVGISMVVVRSLVSVIMLPKVVLTTVVMGGMTLATA